MATFDYARSQQTALRLISRFGQTGAIRRLVAGSGPAHNPGPSVPTDYPAQLVVTAYSTYQRDGTLIQANDKRVYVAAKGLTIDTITPADKIVEEDGTVWSIVRADPLKPANVVVFWDVQVRR